MAFDTQSERIAALAFRAPAMLPWANGTRTNEDASLGFERGAILGTLATITPPWTGIARDVYGLRNRFRATGLRTPRP